MKRILPLQYLDLTLAIRLLDQQNIWNLGYKENIATTIGSSISNVSHIVKILHNYKDLLHKSVRVG